MVAYARALSRSSTIEESEEEESLVKRSEVERKLNLRRILVLLAILLVSLVAASILLFPSADEINCDLGYVYVSHRNKCLAHL